MLTLTLTPVDIGLPATAGMLQPDAAGAALEMYRASGGRMVFSAGYVSVMSQITGDNSCWFSQPTRNGHNFGWSLDVDIGVTLASFMSSGVPELVVAGRDRRSLWRWARQFGWTGTKKSDCHLDMLGGYETMLSRIDDVYGRQLAPDNVAVQRALSALTGEELGDDGVLDESCDRAALLADDMLRAGDRGAFSLQFRRLLAGATIAVKAVGT